MWSEILPSILGMAVTPAAVIGVVLLLESTRPVRIALAFSAGCVFRHVGVVLMIVRGLQGID
jgi:hypothetical protein